MKNEKLIDDIYMAEIKVENIYYPIITFRNDLTKIFERVLKINSDERDIKEAVLDVIYDLFINERYRLYYVDHNDELIDIESCQRCDIRWYDKCNINPSKMVEYEKKREILQKEFVEFSGNESSVSLDNDGNLVISFIHSTICLSWEDFSVIDVLSDFGGKYRFYKNRPKLIEDIMTILEKNKDIVECIMIMDIC